jgi:RND family efflux transporter MFP subunit
MDYLALKGDVSDFSSKNLSLNWKLSILRGFIPLNLCIDKKFALKLPRELASRFLGITPALSNKRISVFLKEFRMNNRNFYLSLVVGMVLLILSCEKGKNDPSTTAASMESLYAQNGRPVTVRPVESGDFSVYLKFPSTVYAAAESTAYASLPDVVREISAKVGDRVEQDQVIVSFSSDNKQLQQARLSWENAQASYNRAQALYENSDISRQDFDNARTQYELAKTGFDSASDMILVKAPISGTITNISVHETENVRPGAPLFTVSAQNGFEAHFLVGLDEIDRIKAGQRVYITGMNYSAEGRVTQVSLTMDKTTQCFPVVAFFDIESSRFMSGMGIDIMVETYNNREALVLPRKELLRTEGGYQAFILKDGRARLVDLRVGESYGLNFEIVEGLEKGDMLICDGLERIEEGARVNAVTALASAAGANQ